MSVPERDHLERTADHVETAWKLAEKALLDLLTLRVGSEEDERYLQVVRRLGMTAFWLRAALYQAADGGVMVDPRALEGTGLDPDRERL